ncbi:MAG: site-specific integrase [Pyrinomonadaceae bacterium]
MLAVCARKPVHLKPLLICALDTAMRKSEMLKLRWQDVDFGAGIMRVKASNSKTERARTVPMTSRLRNELTRLEQRRIHNMDELVFGVRDNVKRSFMSACREAKIEGFRLHDCRHTAITRMIECGISAEKTMKYSGHSQVTTFLRYLNPTNQSVNHDAERLEDFNLNNQLENDVSDAVN